MSQRILRKQLQNKVDYLSRRLGRNFAIDYYNPDGNPYSYKLVEQHWNYGSGIRETTNYRMTAREFNAYLNGMIDCIDGYATAGV